MAQKVKAKKQTVKEKKGAKISARDDINTAKRRIKEIGRRVKKGTLRMNPSVPKAKKRK